MTETQRAAILADATASKNLDISPSIERFELSPLIAPKVREIERNKKKLDDAVAEHARMVDMLAGLKGERDSLIATASFKDEKAIARIGEIDMRIRLIPNKIEELEARIPALKKKVGILPLDRQDKEGEGPMSGELGHLLRAEANGIAALMATLLEQVIRPFCSGDKDALERAALAALNQLPIAEKILDGIKSNQGFPCLALPSWARQLAELRAEVEAMAKVTLRKAQ